MVLTGLELLFAKTRVGRWPVVERVWLERLPERERGLMLELVFLLDARPYVPDGGCDGEGCEAEDA